MILVLLNCFLMFMTACFGLGIASAQGLPTLWVNILGFVIGFCIVKFYYLPAILRIKQEWDEEKNNEL